MAYGLALVFTVACIVLGLLSLWQNGNVFSTDLSTLLRVNRDPALQRAISGDHTVGANPLPEDLGKARIIFRPASVVSRNDVVGLELVSARGVELSNIHSTIPSSRDAAFRL